MILAADGSSNRALTDATSKDWNPSWGPGGIVFSTERSMSPDGNNKLWIIQADGAGLKQFADITALDPKWMGTSIIYTDEFVGGGVSSATMLFNPLTGITTSLKRFGGFATQIDIRPGKQPNRIKPNSEGKVKVAILSSREFDPSAKVDRSTITFGRSGTENSLSKCIDKGKDYNKDSVADLECRFSIKKAKFKAGDKLGILKFATVDGVMFEGRDLILLTDKEDDDDFKDD